MARTGVLKHAVHVQAGAEQARLASDVVDAMAAEPSEGVVLTVGGPTAR